MPDPLAQRIAARFLVTAAYFKTDDIILYGKYKNKRGKIVGFGQDKWGNPTVEIEPIPKGRKQNKVFGLFKIWRADVKERVLAEQAAAAAGKDKTAVGIADYLGDDDDDGGDHDFDE